MREESHLDDMRSAIRGDFERLAERRGGQDLMSVAPEAAQPDPASEEPEPVADPAEPEAREAAKETEAESEQPSGELDAPSPMAEEPVAESDVDPGPVETEENGAELAEEPEEAGEPELAEEPEEAARRSWLDRLLGR